ncbi:polysaccharide lyase family 7 protein [Persicobacter diffluens]|uniref:Alginate lyase 2 domain-containing protein n=1 Tax=Persicobacter diffluens TaxID=981 RepID=A0AAN5AP98_9BACT|nr:hypothetical protein PEDI_46730 [Persicobacter diffluens]
MKNYKALLLIFLVGFFLAPTLKAQQKLMVVNPGFESGLNGWDLSGKVSKSDVAFEGGKSAKMESKGAEVAQFIRVAPRQDYELQIAAKGKGTLFVRIKGKEITRVVNEKDFSLISIPFSSGKAKNIIIGGRSDGQQFRVDAASVQQTSSETEVSVPQPVVINGGFESKFTGWELHGKVSKSDVAFSGNKAAKIDDKASFDQYIRITPGQTYTLQVAVKGKGEVFAKVKCQEFKQEFENKEYELITLDFESGKSKSVVIGGRYTKGQGRFDAFSLKVAGLELDENHQYPSAIIPDLNRWKVTLPVDAKGEDNSRVWDLDARKKTPLEVVGADIMDFEYRPYFYAKNGEVYFRGHCDGVTTKGSKYPRAELRQLVGGGNNYWSMEDHQYLETELRVIHVPDGKQEVCITQIHGPEDEPLRVQYRHGKGVFIIWNEDNKDTENTVPVKLGERVKISVSVAKGYITCHIENLDQQKDYKKVWKSMDATGYFKVGCYTQASKFQSQINKKFTDEPKGSYGEVAVKYIKLEETYPQ